MPHVDLNSDLGESFGAWTMGDDEAMLPLVSSANLACGFHAGDRPMLVPAGRVPRVAVLVIRPAVHWGLSLFLHPRLRLRLDLLRCLYGR